VTFCKEPMGQMQPSVETEVGQATYGEHGEPAAVAALQHDPDRHTEGGGQHTNVQHLQPPAARESFWTAGVL